MIRGLLIIIASVALAFDQYWITSGLIGFIAGCVVLLIGAHIETVGGQDITDLEYGAAIDRMLESYC